MIYKYYTVKYISIISMMQLYFYHRVLLVQCTNCFSSAVIIYFITPKPHKREPFICCLTSYGLYLFHTTAQHKDVLFLCPGDPGWALWLSGLFSFLHLSMWTPAIALLAALWCTVAAGGSGHQVTSPFLPFPNRWLQSQALPSWLMKSCTEVLDFFNKKTHSSLTHWLKPHLLCNGTALAV